MRRAAVVAVAIVAFAASLAEAQPAATLHGTVVDRATQAASRRRESIGRGLGRSELVATDDAGTFAVTLAPGRYAIAVTADFLTPSSTPIALAAGADVAITIEVDPAANNGGETIEITDVAPTAPGEIKIDAKLARAVPGGGDAAKVVQSLPAVARPSAGSTEIVVWGAAPSETRVFVDGVPVPALYHLGGYRSALGNDLIGDIHLTPAAFGAGSRRCDRRRDRHRLRRSGERAGVARPGRRARSQRGRPDRRSATPRSRRLSVRAGSIARSALVEDPQQLAPNAPLPRWTDAQIAARVPLGNGLVLSGMGDRLDRHARSRACIGRSGDPDERAARSAVRARAGHVAPRSRRWLRQRHDLDRRGSFDRRLLVRRHPGEPRRPRSGSAVLAACNRTRLGDHATITAGIDLDTADHALQRDGSLSIPAREGDIYIFGQPPGSDVAADAWHATTTDAAGHVSLDVRAGRLTATLGARLDSWLLTASRLTPRVGATPDLGSQQILFDADPRGSVQLRLSDDAVVRADGGLYHQARDASDTSAVFGTPMLGIEEAWHAIVAAQWRHAPAAFEIAGYARLARQPGRARPRGHAAACAVAHPARHRPGLRRTGHRARDRLARTVWLAELQPVALDAQGCAGRRVGGCSITIRPMV